MKNALLMAVMASSALAIPMTANERARGRYMRDAGGHRPSGDGRRELSPEELATEVKGLLDRKTNEVKAIAEEALGKAKTGEQLTNAAKEIADQALTGFNEVKGRLTEIEQRIAQRREVEQGPQSAGHMFVESEEFKTFAAQTRPRGRAMVEVKDITSLTTDAAGSSGALIVPQRGVMVPLPQRRLTIRALLASGQMNSGTFEYEREKVFTNSADVVAEGAVKPQSDLQFEDATATARTIAHWVRASNQILADAPALRSIIDQRLRYGLAFKEEAELLNGSGSGQHLLGLITAATAYSAPGSLTAATPLDVVRLMILQVVLAEYPANGIVLNPIDMAAIEMSKDAAGNYIVGDPQGTIDKRLWGLPVVETQAIGVDKALVGAFDLAAQLFDRQDATVDVSTEDQDNFVRNKVTIRAEERVALAIYRPQAIVYGDLGRV